MLFKMNKSRIKSRDVFSHKINIKKENYKSYQVCITILNSTEWNIWRNRTTKKNKQLWQREDYVLRTENKDKNLSEGEK